MEDVELNIELLFPLLITASVTIVGWYAAHRLAAKRDRANKIREQQINFVIEAFRRLAKAANRPHLHEVADDIESSITDIQLFGSKSQVLAAQTFAMRLADTGEADLDSLLLSLRDDLREELGLVHLNEKYVWLRIERNP